MGTSNTQFPSSSPSKPLTPVLASPITFLHPFTMTPPRVIVVGGGLSGLSAAHTVYLWIAVKGVVMDVTNWLDEHPGGPQALFSHMGKDASEEFEMLHDDEVIPKYAADIVIGRVKGQEVRLEY